MLSKKTKLIIIISASIVVIIGATILVYFMLQSNQTAQAPETNTQAKQIAQEKVCTDDILTKANTALINRDIDTLTSVSDQIIGLKNYDHDINCLYVLTRFAVDISSATLARDYLDKLNAIRRTEQLSDKITDQAGGITQLTANVEQLEASTKELDKQQEEIRNNLGKAVQQFEESNKNESSENPEN